jgi:hypothetical protein
LFLQHGLSYGRLEGVVVHQKDCQHRPQTQRRLSAG